MIKYATPEFYEELDKKAEEMKQKILNTKTEVTYSGTAYYVANDGDDANDGKSPETAWKTLERVSEAEELKEGDAVFFKRGDLFRGKLQAKTGLTYSAYGEGDKPKFYAYSEDIAKPEKWILYDKENMIWKFADEVVDVGTIWFNGEEAWAVKKVAYYLDGKYYVGDSTEKEFVISEQLTNDFEIFCDAKSELKENGIPKVQSADCKGNLYLRYSGGNPGEVFNSIELSTAQLNIRIGNNHNILFDNLCIKYGVSGFDASFSDGITIRNCEIGCCGGGLMNYFITKNGLYRPVRWGNGFGLWGGCHDLEIYNCWIYECYDAGITQQMHAKDENIEMFNVLYHDNLFERCSYSIEYFLTNNYSEHPENTYSLMKNFQIKDNIFRFAGFGFGRQRNDNEIAHIKTRDYPNRSQDYVIENNIFDRSTESIFHLAFNYGDEIKLRNNTYIQYPSAMFGRYGKTPTKLHRFEIRNVEKIAKEFFGEENGKYYYAY